MAGVFQVGQGGGDVFGQEVKVEVGRIVGIEGFESEALPPVERLSAERVPDTRQAALMFSSAAVAGIPPESLEWMRETRNGAHRTRVSTG
jgi:hypothetical protein